jgi:OOP family OmpA-OmpF porin
MAPANASLSSRRPAARRIALAAGFGALLSLSACIGNTAFDQLNTTTPVGSAFQLAQFKDYAYLARSFGTQSDPGGQAFDAEGSISLTASDNTVAGLAYAYVKKALAAGRGDEVLPEAVPDIDADADNVRLELLRDLDEGRDKAPDEAARAQADFDCWILDRKVPELASAAKICRRSVTASLMALEHAMKAADEPAPEGQSAPGAAEPSQPAAADTGSAAPPPAPPAPAPQQAAQVQASGYTLYFEYRSAVIAPDQMPAIDAAIAAARAGGQSHIVVVGHSDSAEDSEKLSLARARAVAHALVSDGARPESIATSGLGKTDPAVETADHVKEAKNRRVVITLVP